jgi:transposase
VVAAVETGGLSCNQAAKQFGVAISTAINWVRRLRETGTVAPGKMGGHRWDK